MQPGPRTYPVPASVMIGPEHTVPIHIQVYFYFTFGLFIESEFRQFLLQ